MELEDTVLFPEGGGQPSDTGTIGEARCLAVRRTAEAVCRIHKPPGSAAGQRSLTCNCNVPQPPQLVEHVVDAPVEVGLTVEVVVDWARRFDHMQQHSSQHLLSAIALTAYDIKTCSWELGVSRPNDP
eukprot:SAG11_NODE_8496_length_1009_cov_0.867033_3_plen_128_part_00